MDGKSFLFSLVLILAGTSCSDQAGPEKLFKLHSSRSTGVDFANIIQEDEFFNILTYEYIYHGGGVAVGDFNNDGLADIFFTGNMVPNRLYLNQGDFRFRDVTEAAGVGAPGKWCAGAAVVDLNGDGLLDIYVCASTLDNKEKLSNLLFINQGPDADGAPVFVEMAAAYGIDDQGFSTSAAFFDYDLDGDLDLFILTNKLEIAGNNNNYRPKKNDGSSTSTDRLYRNDGPGPDGHPVFTNVSKEAGILHEGFGLGVHIADIDNDGWPDIYVSNDYLSNDLLYINNRNGTFSNRIRDYVKHQSHSSMGIDMADVNNDGLPDIATLEMLPEDNQRRKRMQQDNNYTKYINNERFGYEYQYMRNMLQLNNGQGQDGILKFSEIGCLAGVYATDWSWAPLMIDLDNDGLRDIFITNGFPRDITDLDFAEFRAGRTMAAHREDILNALPSVKIPNYIFKNHGNLVFSNVAEAWGLGQPSFSNGAAFADLDNDGDLDIIVNNIYDQAFIYENRLPEKQKSTTARYLRLQLKGAASNSLGLGAKIWIHYNGQMQFHEHTVYRGYLSSVDPVAHFGLGAAAAIDSMRIRWPDGKEQLLTGIPSNRTLEVRYEDAVRTGNPFKGELPETYFLPSSAISLRHEEHIFVDFNIQRTLPRQFSQLGPALAVGDVDGNGEEDLFIGGSVQIKGVFFLQENGRFRKADLLPAEDQAADDIGCLLFDADGDGDLDLYIVSGGSESEPGSANYQDRFYENAGKGRFVRRKEALPDFYVSGSCVKAADFDRDGDLDLFVGGRILPGGYPQPVSSFILRNDTGPDGRIRFTPVGSEICPDLENIGMVTDALWSDFNNDGWVDLVIAGEWMPITFLQNEKGRFVNVTAQSGVADKTGWWNSLAAADFDNDGDIDYVAGNLGLNSMYRAGPTEPIIAYAKDFDGNGGYDAVIAAYLPDEKGVKKPFPIHSKGDLIKQLAHMKKRFLKYETYSHASIDDLFTEEEMQGAQILNATWMQSSYIENLGPGPDGSVRFRMSPLPVEAQFAPIHGMNPMDVDQDGLMDIVLVGNDYQCELFMGRYDALNGLVLKGDGHGNFKAVNYPQSGLLAPGDARAVVELAAPGGQRYLIVSQNRDDLKVFLQPASGNAVFVEPSAAWAEVTLADGRTRRMEFYYGHSYLSQSSRSFMLPPNTRSIKIFDYSGREIGGDIGY
jgi:enediyne biosynthesis protein E4